MAVFWRAGDEFRKLRLIHFLAEHLFQTGLLQFLTSRQINHKIILKKYYISTINKKSKILVEIKYNINEI